MNISHRILHTVVDITKTIIPEQIIITAICPPFIKNERHSFAEKLHKTSILNAEFHLRIVH